MRAVTETTRPPAGGLGREIATRARSALAELLAAARAVQADLLAFHLACIAGDEPGAAQVALQRRVVVDERARDAVAHGTCLARLAAAMHVDLDVEGGIVRGQHQRLANDHDRRLAAEVFLHRLAIDEDATA